MTGRSGVQVLDFGDGHGAPTARVHPDADLAAVAAELGLNGPRPVLVVVGGASGLDDRSKERLRSLFSQALVPAARA